MSIGDKATLELLGTFGDPQPDPDGPRWARHEPVDVPAYEECAAMPASVEGAAWLFARAFGEAITLRADGGDAAAQADRTFLETLVRVHRAGEGVGFDGIQPTGADVPPQVVAADRALDEGTIEPLRGLIPDERFPELQHRFDDALAKKAFDVDDLPAAREYIEAYVKFFKYAEGEDHAPAGGHHHS